MSRGPLAVLFAAVALFAVSGAYYMTHRRTSAGTSPVAVDRVAKAVRATSAASSFRFAYQGTISAGAQSFTMSGSGAYDGARRIAAVNVRFQLPPGSGLPSGPLTGDAIVDRSNGFVEYIRMTLPEFQRNLPAGKTWVKLDVGRMLAKEGVDLGQLQNVGAGDPSELLSFLQHSGTSRAVGLEDVNGVPTTHYSATVDLQRVADRADSATRASLERAMAVTGVRQYPIEAWIDNANLVRRVRVKYVAQAGSQSVQTTVDETLTGFGGTVQIALPSEAEVVDLESLAGQ
jgi:hypothetical protein